MAITAIGLTAAILAAIPSAGTSLVVAGTLVAAGTGVYQLSQSVGAYYSEKAAEDVAIDPVMADISLKSPDLKAVAFDLAGLGLDAFDLLKVVNLLGDSIRAARRTGDLLDLARRAAAIPQLGEEGTRVLMASVTREVQIQQGITRVITALGKHFKPGDIADIAADMARLDERIVSEALTHLQASGRVRPLTEDVLEEIYGLEGAAHRITNSGWLTAQGMYDPSNGMLFLKGGRFEEILVVGAARDRAPPADHAATGDGDLPQGVRGVRRAAQLPAEPRPQRRRPRHGLPVLEVADGGDETTTSSATSRPTPCTA